VFVLFITKTFKINRHSKHPVMYSPTKKYLLCFPCGKHNLYIEIGNKVDSLLPVSSNLFRNKWKPFRSVTYNTFLDYVQTSNKRCSLPLSLNNIALKKCSHYEVSTETFGFSTGLNTSIEYTSEAHLGSHFTFYQPWSHKTPFCSLRLQYFQRGKILYCIYEENQRAKYGAWFLNSFTIPLGLRTILATTVCLVILIQTMKDPLRHKRLTSVFYCLKRNIFTSLKVVLQQKQCLRSSKILFLIEIVNMVFIPFYKRQVLLYFTVPVKQYPAENFTQLVQSGYTYLFDPYMWFNVRSLEWIEDRYGFRNLESTYPPRNGGRYQYKYLETFFLKPKNGRKFAFQDNHFDDDLMISLIKQIVGFQYSCFRMYPPEEGFSPIPMFAEFCSSYTDIFDQTYIRLMEAGSSDLEVKRNAIVSIAHKLNLNKEIRKLDSNRTKKSDRLRFKSFHAFRLDFLHLKSLFKFVCTLIFLSIVINLLELHAMFLKQSKVLLKVLHQMLHRFVVYHYTPRARP